MMPPRRHYTDEEAAWIADEAPRATNSRTMAEVFERLFGRRMPPVTLRTYCRTHGIAAGWQGTRDRSASHRTACGMWVEGGVKMTDAQHDWWLEHGEMPPAGTNVLRAPDGMELVTDAELLAMNRLGIEWSDLGSLRACAAIARLAVARDAAVRSNKGLARERRRAYMAAYYKVRKMRAATRGADEKEDK